jgi:glutamate---cysteine ligase / carboxylate-amine ligase
VIEHAFGESPELTVGVEEELFVVDPATLEPVPVPEELLEGERRKRELFQAVVELTTGPCVDAVEAARGLGEARTEARVRAAELGVALAATGTWPTAVAEEQAITPDPGFLEFADYAGPSARRQFCSGLHVHIAVGSPEACLAALESVLPWLPALLAVSANSPWFEGRESGMCSMRAELLALLPRSGAPPVFASYAEWSRFAERLVELGIADSYRRIWWDVRPHPGFGTLEIRAADQPTPVEVSAAVAALAQAMVAAAEPGPPADRGVYMQNRWAASRFGADAELIHPDGKRLVRAPELLAELVERVGPTAERLGSTPLLAPLDGLAQAAGQLERGRRDGLPSLCAELVAST